MQLEPNTVRGVVCLPLAPSGALCDDSWLLLLLVGLDVHGGAADGGAIFVAEAAPSILVVDTFLAGPTATVCMD